MVPNVAVLADGAGDPARVGRAARVITFLYVLLFFSNIPVHGFLYGGWPVRPVIIFVVIAFALFPYLYYVDRFRFLLSPVGLWSFLYLVVSLAWFVMFGGDSTGPLLQRIYAAAFLMFSYGLIALHPASLQAARVAILCGVVLAGLCNFIEILNPTAFLPAGAFYGRASGFYGNPNLSGAALVLGTIASLSLVRPAWRWTLLALSLAAVILTLSRAAILGWIIGVCLLTLARVIRVRTAVLGVGVVAGCAILAWQLLAQIVIARTGINEDVLRERATWFVERSATQDASQVERTRVAESAWKLVVAHPLLGNGLGRTEDWSESASTHNMYLYFMADQGILGAFLYPLLILACVWQARGEVRRTAFAFATFAVFWGFASHNIVGEYYALLSFAVIAAWCHWSFVRAHPAEDAKQDNGLAPNPIT